MKRRSLFPGIVFGLLTTNMIVVGITLYLAHSDRSFAVEPAYDQRALSWDEQAAGQRRAARGSRLPASRAGSGRCM